MKKILILLIFLQGCCNQSIPETSGPMEGEPINIVAPAYDEMCEREPESPLCPEKEDGN